MALDQSVLSELLDAFRTGEGLDLIKQAAALVCQELIEVELTAQIGADRYERTDARSNERNGHRSRVLSTKAGDVELAIPKLRKGSFFPSILEPAGASTRPSMPWSWRPTCTGCPPGPSTSWWPLSGWTRVSAGPRCPETSPFR